LATVGDLVRVLGDFSGDALSGDLFGAVGDLVRVLGEFSGDALGGNFL